MRIFRALVIATSISGSQLAPATPANASSPNEHLTFNARGFVTSFYGVPMNLTPSGLTRFRYEVGHYSAEGDTYTFYTIKGQGGVRVKVQFHKGKISAVSTTSPNAVGPQGIRVGSLLSEVKAAWPKGQLKYGVEEHPTFVVYDTEPGLHDIVTYYFEPKDMPPQAFDSDYRKSREIDVPDIKVVEIAFSPPPLPEADYRFLSVMTGPCVPKIGLGIEPKHRSTCKQMTKPERYRGIWYTDFETSFFKPIGEESCAKTKFTRCAELVAGKALPWPSRWACPRSWQVEFIGRRNVLPGFAPPYRIVVDEVIDFKRLTDPPHEIGECDESAE